MEHLGLMDHLKRSVSLQAYGQKDPLIVYKTEAKTYFEGFFDEIKKKVKKNIIYTDADYLLKRINLHSEMEKKAKLAIENSGKKDNSTDKKNKTIVKTEEERVGRNEPCPCKSGRKYKKCCGVEK